MIEMTSTYERAFDEHFANCFNRDQCLVIVNIRTSFPMFVYCWPCLRASVKEQVIAHSQGPEKFIDSALSAQFLMISSGRSYPPMVRVSEEGRFWAFNVRMIMDMRRAQLICISVIAPVSSLNRSSSERMQKQVYQHWVFDTRIIHLRFKWATHDLQPMFYCEVMRDMAQKSRCSGMAPLGIAVLSEMHTIKRHYRA